jgi:hypothetical protein
MNSENSNNKTTIIISLVVLLILVLLGLTIFGLTVNPALTENIRDIFVIFLAFESIIIGAALVILVIQITKLINLLNNEIRPMIEATNETIHNLRGTTKFLSENMVEPVVKLNSYMAGFQKMMDLINFTKK